MALLRPMFHLFVFGVLISVLLTVQPEVTVDKDRQVVYQAVGYSRELTCEAKGNPVPDEVMWYKDNQALDNPNK